MVVLDFFCEVCDFMANRLVWLNLGATRCIVFRHACTQSYGSLITGIIHHGAGHPHYLRDTAPTRAQLIFPFLEAPSNIKINKNELWMTCLPISLPQIEEC